MTPGSACEFFRDGRVSPLKPGMPLEVLIPGDESAIDLAGSTLSGLPAPEPQTAADCTSMDVPLVGLFEVSMTCFAFVRGSGQLEAKKLCGIHIVG